MQPLYFQQLVDCHLRPSRHRLHQHPGFSGVVVKACHSVGKDRNRSSAPHHCPSLGYPAPGYVDSPSHSHRAPPRRIPTPSPSPRRSSRSRASSRSSRSVSAAVADSRPRCAEPPATKACLNDPSASPFPKPRPRPTECMYTSIHANQPKSSRSTQESPQNLHRINTLSQRRRRPACCVFWRAPTKTPNPSPVLCAPPLIWNSRFVPQRPRRSRRSSQRYAAGRRIGCRAGVAEERFVARFIPAGDY